MEIAVNGKICHEREMCVYSHVSETSCSTLHSLVDRRVNDDAVENDTRVIEQHPNRKVDIRGIDNYEIASSPLVTVGGGNICYFWGGCANNVLIRMLW